VILFGSYASGKQTAASDIDILIVYGGTREKKEVYDLCWDIVDLPNLELRIYSEEEYAKLKRSRSLFVKEAEEKGIVVWNEL